jgi:hypothetical protein
MFEGNSALYHSICGMDLHVRSSCLGRCLFVAPEGLWITFLNRTEAPKYFMNVRI